MRECSSLPLYSTGLKTFGWGVSVENQAYTKRIDYLREVPAAVRFLSCEPLLGPLELDLVGIDWVITGGESGPKHRPIEADWVRSIRDQCKRQDAAFFHKQWGGVRPKSNGRTLDGQLYEEMPKAWQLHLEKASPDSLVAACLVYL